MELAQLMEYTSTDGTTWTKVDLFHPIDEINKIHNQTVVPMDLKLMVIIEVGIINFTGMLLKVEMSKHLEKSQTFRW